MKIKLEWRLVVALCVWLALPFAHSSSLYAQKLHAIVIGDISPAAEWGKYTPNVALDLLTMAGMLRDNMPEQQLEILQLELEENEASDPQKLLGFVHELKPRPEDTVMFYFSGHGASDDQGHYLALAKGKLPRKQILEAMVSKGARLAVLITDCCNLRSDGYAYLAPQFVPRVPHSPTPVFRALFLEPKGVVDINSSAPGESAFFTPYDEEMRRLPGSIFTKELSSWFEKNRDKRPVWEELVRGVSLQVHSAFHDFYPKGVNLPQAKLTQTQQTVYPLNYPGMPENKGPRTGLLVRDFNGKGSIITSVEPGSPSAQVFLVGKNAFSSLLPQQVIVSVNGQAIENTEQLRQAMSTSPQIVKLGIRDAAKGNFDILMRMKY